MARAVARPRSQPLGQDPERVASAVRELLRGIAPQLKVERRWGMPWYVGNDLVVLVGAFSHHASAEFWRGSTLKDPAGLLEGTGKNLRHVKLRSIEAATRPEFVALLREAIALDAVSPPRAR
ncbi:MAG TPA: DUF1801 domain-containing protein [Thermoplasmata archaeon]|nr:DUF1801 domain-containing protein [Thermoplasmata archaeon]